MPIHPNKTNKHHLSNLQVEGAYVSYCIPLHLEVSVATLHSHNSSIAIDIILIKTAAGVLSLQHYYSLLIFEYEVLTIHPQ